MNTEKSKLYRSRDRVRMHTLVAVTTVLALLLTAAVRSSASTGPAEAPLRVYEGRPGVIVLDTTRLAPARYTIILDGEALPDVQVFVVSTDRPSAGSFQDECLPGPNPQLSSQDYRDPDLKAHKIAQYRDWQSDIFRQTGLTATMGMMSGSPREPMAMLDVSARTGMLISSRQAGKQRPYVIINSHICCRNRARGLADRALVDFNRFFKTGGNSQSRMGSRYSMIAAEMFLQALVQCFTNKGCFAGTRNTCNYA